MHYPIDQLIETVEPHDRTLVQNILLAMWAQPQGRGLREVVANLLLAIEGEVQRLKVLADPSDLQPDYLNDLKKWNLALRTINEAMDQLDRQAKSQSGAGVSHVSTVLRHPLSRHGFTSHSVYSAAWNRHEASASQVATDNALCARYRRLQWWWIRAQAQVIAQAQIDWSDYDKVRQMLVVNGQTADTDPLQPLCQISFQGVGRALRRLSLSKHRELLSAAAQCCFDDVENGFAAFARLGDQLEEWQSGDAGIQRERQTCVDAFRLVSEKALDQNKIRARRRSHKRPGAGRHRGPGGGKGDPRSGYLGGQTTIQEEAPEDLPEFETWVRCDEVIGAPHEDDLEADDGIEAPRRTGLKLVDPADLKGFMARAKAQSHHLAMVRQGFSWDQNALSFSERSVMLNLVESLPTQLTTSVPDGWWPKAMLAVGWICGRSLQDVLELAYLGPLDMEKGGSDVLAVGAIEGVCYWRLPLRLPNLVKVDAFTNGVTRIDHVLVPDGSGLVAALIRAHQLRGVGRSQIFGWLRQPQQRIAKVVQEASLLHGEVGDRAIQPGLLERDLRVTLLNLAPDKTVAWMLAGSKAQSSEPRMFYAAHTAAELVVWALRAHEKMGIPVCQTQQPTAASAVWPEEYAGAKFLPQLDVLRLLVATATKRAGTYPPAHALYRKSTSKSGRTPTVSESPQTEAAEEAAPLWDDVRCWRAWHDDVVFWVWVLQALQTSQRATRFPIGIYEQWLREPARLWVSLEDKLTTDRDESRSGVITPVLSNAFTLLTQVQAMYRSIWEVKQKKRRTSRKPHKESRKVDLMPSGFMVFDDAQKPSELSPAWIQAHLKSHFHLNWPVNFNRATLRRALSQLGIDGDGLDAFCGHGGLADRVHDRHSLLDFGAFHEALQRSLKEWADQLKLKRLDLPTNIRPSEMQIKIQKRRALRQFKERARQMSREVPARRTSSDVVKQDFERWQDFVSRQLEPRRRERSGLAHLKLWHTCLLQSDHPFAKYVLGIPCELELPEGPQTSEGLRNWQMIHKDRAQEFEDLVIAWVARGEMNRSVAAHGLNLSYLLCKARNPLMPTTRVAMTAHARVSPFTPERIGRAVSADQWRGNCVDALNVLSIVESGPKVSRAVSTPAEDIDKIKLALCSFLNLTTEAERWLSCVRALITAPSSPQRHIFDASYDFRIAGLQGRVRNCRAFLDIPTTHTKPLPALAPEEILGRKRDVYRTLCPDSVAVPHDLSKWIHGIRCYAHMQLPPVVAAYLEGSLNDQSIQGPLAKTLGFNESTSTIKSRARAASHRITDEDEPEALPPLWLDGEVETDPFGWVPAIANLKSAAHTWLRAFLSQNIGPPHPKTTLEDLSDSLMEARDEVPSKFLRAVGSLIPKLRQYHGLEPDEQTNSRADQVDRQVVDFDTYEQLLDALEVSCVTSRMPERQTRMRLLIVLAFRCGMRRREILFLRRGDIDLPGDGRFHIRPYPGHTLKTGFSRRSLPILPLLNERERQWLVQTALASESLNEADTSDALLIPEREHDTLARDAIALLRRVGNDESLKLHHLRHSFASWMTLKIVFARHPQWAQVFAGHPAIHREMVDSPKLLGTVLKPQLAAGDFLVIPRMLGHSSYEVSLTNYVHTLDLVSALFVNHQLADEIVPRRDLPHLVNQRFKNAMQLRARSVAAWVPASSGTPEAPTAVLPDLWSTQVNHALLSLKRQSSPSGTLAAAENTSPVTLQQIQNWHSPRHALALRNKLLAGIDRLAVDDVSLLVKLGQIYWRDDPPMFWFSRRQVKSMSKTAATGLARVQHDLTDLLRLLHQMILTDGEVFFWRYKNAPEHAHRKIWDAVVLAGGFGASYQQLSGSSAAADSLGVSLGLRNAKRSPLPGIVWRTVGSILQGQTADWDASAQPLIPSRNALPACSAFSSIVNRPTKSTKATHPPPMSPPCAA